MSIVAIFVLTLSSYVEKLLLKIWLDLDGRQKKTFCQARSKIVCMRLDIPHSSVAEQSHVQCLDRLPEIQSDAFAFAFTFEKNEGFPECKRETLFSAVVKTWRRRVNCVARCARRRVLYPNIWKYWRFRTPDNRSYSLIFHHQRWIGKRGNIVSRRPMRPSYVCACVFALNFNHFNPAPAPLHSTEKC